MDPYDRSVSRRDALKLAAATGVVPLVSGESLAADRRARYNQSGSTRYASNSARCSSSRDRDYFELTNTSLYYRGSTEMYSGEWAHQFYGASHASTRLFDRYDRYDGDVKPAYDLRRLTMDIIGRGTTKRVEGPEGSHRKGQKLSTVPEYEGGDTYDVDDALIDVTEYAIAYANPKIGLLITAAQIANSYFGGTDTDTGANYRYDYQFGNSRGGQKKDAHLVTAFTVLTREREMDVQLSTDMKSHPRPQCAVHEDSQHANPKSAIRLVIDPEYASANTTQSGTTIAYEDITDPVIKHEATPGKDVVQYYFPTERVPPIPMPAGNLDKDRLGEADDRYDDTDIYTNYVYVDLENEDITITDPQGSVIGEARFDVGQDISLIVPFDSNGSGEPDAFALLILGTDAASAGLFTNVNGGEQDNRIDSNHGGKVYAVSDIQSYPPRFDLINSRNSATWHIKENEIAGRFLVEFDQGPLGNSVELFEYEQSYDADDFAGGIIAYVDYLSSYPGNQVDYGYTQYLKEYAEDTIY